MDSLSFPRSGVTAIKLRKKLPLLLERAGVRRVKIRKKALFDPLILTFSRREKGLYILNLMAVTLRRGNAVRDTPASRTAGAVLRHSHAGAWERCRFIHFGLYKCPNKGRKSPAYVELAGLFCALSQARALIVIHKSLKAGPLATPFLDAFNNGSR